jgi:hypothetical protein
MEAQVRANHNLGTKRQGAADGLIVRSAQSDQHIPIWFKQDRKPATGLNRLWTGNVDQAKKTVFVFRDGVILGLDNKARSLNRGHSVIDKRMESVRRMARPRWRRRDQIREVISRDFQIGLTVIDQSRRMHDFLQFL